MKKIIKTIMLSIALAGITSCDFETDNYQQIPTENAYKSVQDIQNGMNGAYYALGSYHFLGNYVISYGDFCAGVCSGSRSSGHFYPQSAWIVSETDAELSEIWYYGFQVIDRCTRTIQGGKDVLTKNNLHLDESDKASIKLYMAQCHAMKALANYYLINLFASPYHTGKDKLGLPLVKEEPIEPFTNIKRATVSETYKQITDDLDEADKLMKEAQDSETINMPSAFYMGPMALEALKARVYLSIGEYAQAENAAKKAIELKGNGDGTGEDKVPAEDIYLSMWTSLAINDEDLFTIAKNESDNLSANALNTLYGSYGASINNNIWDLFGKNDIRVKLLSGNSIGKYAGLPTSAATSNIPIFRKSEMSLIIAEVEARNGHISEAQKYLLFTAKRNKDITSAEMLPKTTDELLAFIAEERIREFVGEGHRLYDARRMGLNIHIPGFKPFDIAQFVFPIPSDEINAGFCNQQNEGWENALPEK